MVVSGSRHGRRRVVGVVGVVVVVVVVAECAVEGRLLVRWGPIEGRCGRVRVGVVAVVVGGQLAGLVVHWVVLVVAVGVIGVVLVVVMLVLVVLLLVLRLRLLLVGHSLGGHHLVGVTDGGRRVLMTCCVLTSGRHIHRVRVVRLDRVGGLDAGVEARGRATCGDRRY